MDLLVYLLWLFIVGLVIGAVARLLVPGTAGMGILATALSGIAGAFLAGLAMRYLIEPREDWVGVLVAVLCAAAVIALVGQRRGAVR
jgi:uncharacterized membrane protein YeaQ/YmgE (transglycosylase-associated protein family)